MSPKESGVDRLDTIERGGGMEREERMLAREASENKGEKKQRKTTKEPVIKGCFLIERGGSCTNQ